MYPFSSNSFIYASAIISANCIFSFGISLSIPLDFSYLFIIFMFKYILSNSSGILLLSGHSPISCSVLFHSSQICWFFSFAYFTYLSCIYFCLSIFPNLSESYLCFSENILSLSINSCFFCAFLSSDISEFTIEVIWVVYVSNNTCCLCSSSNSFSKANFTSSGTLSSCCFICSAIFCFSSILYLSVIYKYSFSSNSL